jgi:hypothetical protein
MATITGVPIASVPVEGDPSYPLLVSITISDLVGPLAANRQPIDLKTRDDTLRDRVNLLVDAMNEIGEGEVGSTVKFLPRDGTDAMLGNLDAGANKVTNLADATAALDAMNRQASDARYVEIAGDTMTGLLTLSGDPTVPLQAATKQYVDAQDAIIQIGYSNFNVFPSDTSFVIPANTSRIMVELWGGGGGGRNGAGSGGGGGGAYVQAIIAVTPGQTFDIVVGAGGAALTAGGDSSFILQGGGPPEVVAGGGQGNRGQFDGADGGTPGTINGVLTSFGIVGGTAGEGGSGGSGIGTNGAVPGGGGSGSSQFGGGAGVGAAGRVVVWF